VYTYNEQKHEFLLPKICLKFQLKFKDQVSRIPRSWSFIT